MNLTATIGEVGSLLLESGDALLLEDGGTLAVAGSNAVSVATNSLVIEDVVEERSVARFSVVDTDRQWMFDRGQPVTITTGSGTAVGDVTMDSSDVTVGDPDVTVDGSGEAGGTTVLFTGFVEQAEMVEPAGVRFHNIDAVDNHYLADKRLVARSYLNQAANQIVDDLYARYLEEEGVVFGSVGFDSRPVTWPVIVYDYIPVSQALTELADLVGYWWYITPSKVLHFRRRNAYAAPWTLTDADVLRSPAPKLRRSAPDYRNVQYIRNVRDLTDLQVETFVGDGERRSFTVGFEIAEAPTVTVNGSPQTVAIRGLDTTADWYWNKGDKTVTQDSGGTKLGAADTLRVEYVGMFDSVVVSPDQDGIDDRKTVEGGTGKVEQVAKDRRIEGRDTAFKLAAAKLDKFGVAGQTLQFTTRKAGLKPGMLLTVDTDLFGLTSDLLVVEVDVRDVEATELWYTVTAVEGPQDESWSRFFARLYDVPDVQSWSENLEDVSTVTRLFEFSKTWTTVETPNIWAEFKADGTYTAGDARNPAFDPGDRLTHVEVLDGAGVVLRKVLTQQTVGVSEIVSTLYLAPQEANATTTEVVWYGGYRATSEVGSGVEVARETLADVKTQAEAWNVIRTDTAPA